MRQEEHNRTDASPGNAYWTPQATPTVTIELVNMEETTEKNVIGEKTATASKLAIVNRTGSEIAAIYIR